MGKTHAKNPPAITPKYYHSSDRVGAGLLFWLPVVGGGGAGLLGFIYAFIAYLLYTLEESGWLIVVVPFFAVALTGVGWCVCQLGKVRRWRLRLPVALCVGAMGLYAAWDVYLNFAAERKIFDAVGPVRLWHDMRGLAADRGPLNWIGWALEAATVSGFIVYLLRSNDAEIPFCEKCGSWTGDALTLELNSGPCDALAMQLAGGQVDGLRALGLKTDSARRFVRVRMMVCPCGSSRFVSVERVSTTPGKKGGWKFGPTYSGDRRKSLHYDFGTASEEAVGPIVSNLEIDFETQRKLEDLRTELRKDD